MTATSDNGAMLMAAIRGFWRDNQMPPTLRELQSETGISSLSVIAYHLHALERKGLIRRTPGLSRSIRLTDAGSQPVQGAA